MKVTFSLFVALISSLLTLQQSEAATVHYRDESGTVHYVNTDYAKVPERYRGQVEEQLNQIEKQRADSVPVPSDFKPPSLTKGVGPESLTIDTSPSVQVTNENRLSRLTEALNELQITGYFPPSVNINSGVVGYIDRQGKKVFVTPDTLSSVKPEYLSQVDAQIIGLEKIAKQARAEKPMIAGTAVEVFTKESCTECVKLLTLLQVHKIPYLNFDVNHTSQGMEFYKSLNNKAELPITRVKSALVPGVDVAGIKKALAAMDAVTPTASSGTQTNLIIPESLTKTDSPKSEPKIETMKLQKQNLTVNHLLGK